MWIDRVTQPVLMSRIIITMTLNAVSVWALYTIDRMSPVMICRDSVIPNRNPIFHRKEMEEGVGRSMSDFFC